MTCTTCHRKAVRGETLCQRCRHRAYPMQGPRHEPTCEMCFYGLRRALSEAIRGEP